MRWIRRIVVVALVAQGIVAAINWNLTKSESMYV